jgi:DNA (cytosine-5)-methyltransferase 1
LDQQRTSIRHLRFAAKMRMRDLASRAKVSLDELSKCERGLVIPQRDFFDAVALVLSVSSEQLIQTHQSLYTEAVPGEGYTTALPESTSVYPPTANLKTGKISILDLFCGVGGFSHGFEQTQQYQVMAGLDMLPDRIATFRANHPAANAFCADIRYINLSALIENSPKPEVLIGGPPCQGFSSIRPFRTLTEKDLRNNLFEYFILAVDTLRPKWFVLENVVGLLTHKQGETLHQIIELFCQIGYKAEWKVLNAALYGLPQRRERLILVGNASGKSFRWPEPTYYFNGKSMAGRRHGQYTEPLSLFNDAPKPAVSVMEAIHDLPEVASGESAVYYRNDVVPTEYEAEMRGDLQCVALHEATRHSAKMLEIIRLSGSNRNALPPGLTTSGFSTSYSRLDADLPSVTLTVNFVHPASNKCIHPYQNRALTPREGARLQGFEDKFQFIGNRAQVVKQIGNAVPPLLGRVIAEALSTQF